MSGGLYNTFLKLVGMHHTVKISLIRTPWGLIYGDSLNFCLSSLSLDFSYILRPNYIGRKCVRYRLLLLLTLIYRTPQSFQEKAEEYFCFFLKLHLMSNKESLEIGLSKIEWKTWWVCESLTNCFWGHFSHFCSDLLNIFKPVWSGSWCRDEPLPTLFPIKNIFLLCIQKQLFPRILKLNCDLTLRRALPNNNANFVLGWVFYREFFVNSDIPRIPALSEAICNLNNWLHWRNLFLKKFCMRSCQNSNWLEELRRTNLTENLRIHWILGLWDSNFLFGSGSKL